MVLESACYSLTLIHFNVMFKTSLRKSESGQNLFYFKLKSFPQFISQAPVSQLPFRIHKFQVVYGFLFRLVNGLSLYNFYFRLERNKSNIAYSQHPPPWVGCLFDCLLWGYKEDSIKTTTATMITLKCVLQSTAIYCLLTACYNIALKLRLAETHFLRHYSFTNTYKLRTYRQTDRQTYIHSQ